MPSSGQKRTSALQNLPEAASEAISAPQCSRRGSLGSMAAPVKPNDDERCNHEDLQRRSGSGSTIVRGGNDFFSGIPGVSMTLSTGMSFCFLNLRNLKLLSPEVRVPAREPERPGWGFSYGTASRGNWRSGGYSKPSESFVEPFESGSSSMYFEREAEVPPIFANSLRQICGARAAAARTRRRCRRHKSD